MTQQHVEMKIDFSGNGAVMLVTNLGWAKEGSVTLDMVSIEDARGVACEFIDNMIIVPFENCSSNEPYVDRARGILSKIRDSIADAVPNGDTASVLVDGIIFFKVSFKDTYVV